MIRTILLTAVVASTLAACDARAQSSETLSIFRSWIGRTLDAELSNGQKTVVLFSADGTASVTGGSEDKGTWRLDAEGYCVTWTKLRGGKEFCFTILPMGGSFLTVIRNTNEVTAKLTPR